MTKELKQLSGSQYTNIFIDEVVEPSKALECLERLGAEKLARGQLIRNDDKVEPYLNTIKQALLKAEKQEKAWEVVKKKMVSIRLLYACSCVEQYNDETLDLRGFAYGLPKLTKQEFALLKEMLE